MFHCKKELTWKYRQYQFNLFLQINFWVFKSKSKRQSTFRSFNVQVYTLIMNITQTSVKCIISNKTAPIFVDGTVFFRDKCKLFSWGMGSSFVFGTCHFYKKYKECISGTPDFLVENCQNCICHGSLICWLPIDKCYIFIFSLLDAGV